MQKVVVSLFSILFLSSLVYAGISPVYKTISLKNNDSVLVYYTVSQGSEEPQTIQVKLSGPEWASLSEQVFYKVPKGVDKQLIVSLNPFNASPGVYKAHVITVIGSADAGEFGGYALVSQERSDLTIILLNPDGSIPSNEIEYPKSVEVYKLTSLIQNAEQEYKEKYTEKNYSIGGVVQSTPTTATTSNNPVTSGLTIVNQASDSTSSKTFYLLIGIVLVSGVGIVFIRQKVLNEHKIVSIRGEKKWLS